MTHTNQNTQFRFSVILLALTLFVFTNCSNDDEAPTVPNTLSGLIDDYLARNQPASAPGMAIAIQQNGQMVYEKSAGLARRTGNRAIDSQTQFRIGSITKPMTAIAMMKLVEENEISLSDKLLDHIPELPASYEDITLEHLLTHRSGMLDFIDDITDISALNNLTTSQILDVIPGSGLENLQFAPGTAGDYCNTGYALAALVIEKITGMSYPDYLQQIIFDPAGMTNSFVISENDHLGDHGDNYALSFGNTLLVKGFNSLIYGPSGVASNTEDMIRFINTLLAGDIISLSTLNQMTQTVGPVPEIADYGLGWMTGTGNYWHNPKYTDINDFWHLGGFDGYRTILYHNPDLDLQVVILTNNGQDTQNKFLDILEITRNFYK